MFLSILSVLFIFHLPSLAEEQKWVWNDNNRENKGRSIGLRYPEKVSDPRYSVYENYDDVRPNGPLGFNDRPIRPRPELLDRPIRPGPDLFDRPIRPGGIPPSNRPLYPGSGFVGNRPGGVYGNGGYPNGGYGRPQGSRPEYYPNDPRDPGVLTGPIPSWVREGPFKNFDTCMCTEKFNCRSPGLSYGHCDVGKKYCCYNRNKIEDIGSDYPSRPIHSPENGILVGPGGPVGVPGRPIGRPIRPGGGFGRPGFTSNRPLGYGQENGVLVGPGRRPYDRRREI